MTGKIPNLDPKTGIVRIYGVVHQYYSPKWQRWITRSWPRGSGPNTPYRDIGRKTFAAVVRAIKRVPPEEMAAADEATANTPYLQRDFLFKAATGTLLEFTDQNGRLWMSTRVAIQNIQPMLDSISAIPGAMVVRGPGYWTAIVPSDPGMLIRTNAATKIPEFVLPETVIFPLLDAMAAPIGAILSNGADGWEFIAPGDVTDVLTSNGAGFAPSWQASTGGGGTGLPVTHWDLPSQHSGGWIVGFDGLTAAEFGSGWSSIIATNGKTAGKWYFEFIQTAAGSYSPGVGIAYAAYNQGSYLGSDANSWGQITDGEIFAGSGSKINGSSGLAVGDVTGVAVDMAAGTIDFYKNNVANGGVSGVAFVGTIYIGMTCQGGGVGRLKSLPADLVYAPPSGFDAWG